MERKDITGNVYGKWTVLYRIEDPADRHSKWLAKCACGTEKIVYQDNLVGGKTFSCGCSKVEGKQRVTEGMRWGTLTVTERIPTTQDKRGMWWKCSCECGNQVILNTRQLLEHKSCGCKEYSKKTVKDITGNRYGLLKALSRVDMQEKGTRQRWLCLCECGSQIEVVRSNLVSGNTRSCGCLDDRINSKPVSKQQRAIAEMLGGWLNYKVGTFYIDVALFQEGKKIAIEYDSYYWHKNKKDQDNRKTLTLKELGWKLLRIKSDWKIPDKSQLILALQALEDNDYCEMTLDDWVKREES